MPFDLSPLLASRIFNIKVYYKLNKFECSIVLCFALFFRDQFVLFSFESMNNDNYGSKFYQDCMLIFIQHALRKLSVHFFYLFSKFFLRSICRQSSNHNTPGILLSHEILIEIYDSRRPHGNDY